MIRRTLEAWTSPAAVSLITGLRPFEIRVATVERGSIRSKHVRGRLQVDLLDARRVATQCGLGRGRAS